MIAPGEANARVGTASALERILRRDRLAIVAVLGALTVLSWVEMFLPGEVPSGGGRGFG